MFGKMSCHVFLNICVALLNSTKKDESYPGLFGVICIHI